MLKIAHKGSDVENFVKDYFVNDKKTLFIGTVGFNCVGLYFPLLFGNGSKVDYRFFVESRTEVAAVLRQLGLNNRDSLRSRLASQPPQFFEIDIVAEDEAVVAGRNAVRIAANWLQGSYTDVVVDATAMSRGVCFSVTKQVINYCGSKGINVHIVVAERGMTGLQAKTISSDQICYMHGFQQDMELDVSSTALKLWVPQLSENYTHTADRIYQFLAPNEACPILPFPATSPRRSDELMLEFRRQLGAWGTGYLDVIYAHESDPIDVCNTIGRLHKGRAEIFKANGIEARTVLTPTGWRVGSIGMLLAALEYNVPVAYAENIGYIAHGNDIPPIDFSVPDCRWHLMLPPAI